MLYFALLNPTDLTARRLILSLLSAVDSEARNISDLVRAGALFGFEDATIRMAATRLLRDGLLQKGRARGQYGLGPGAVSVTAQVQRWREALTRTKPWSGEWLAVHTSHLGRVERAALRGRERALRLFGFAESMGGLWVRPDNLTEDLAGIQAQLTLLGLEPAAIMMAVSHATVGDGAPPWRDLWAVAQIADGYKAAIDAMEKSGRRLAAAPYDGAAREYLLVGQSVIRMINLDPLLPEEFLPRRDFAAMVEMMLDYDRAGRKAWAAFFNSA